MTIFYKNGGFYAEPQESAVEISDELHAQLIEGQSQGKQIVTAHDGLPMLADPKPSAYHEWNGWEWVITEEQEEAQKAESLQRWITAIDDKATAIYSQWTRFESEYKARKEAAEAYKAAGYKGEVSRYITSFAVPAGLDNKTATDLILVQAAGLQKLQDELGAQRMRKYELKRPHLSLEEMQAIFNNIIDQMNNLEEAYRNG